MSAQRQSEEHEPKPPQPPPMSRGLRLRRSQWIGFPIIALVPVLAMFGVFGERWESSEGEIAGLHARVRYPIRLRSMSTKTVFIEVANRSSAARDTVDVLFDPAYMTRFSGVSFIPSPRDAYTLSLTDLRPGETRTVHVELQGQSIGRHSGRVVVRSRGDSVAIPMRTTVFP